MKIYSVAIVAFKGETLFVKSVSCVASSDEEAHTFGMWMAKMACPEPLGYTGHDIAHSAVDETWYTLR